MVKVASRYSIIQFGLCLFHLNGDGIGYKASPYNFYLFPESSGSDLVMSASAIDFLRKNHMDFGTWIEKGVTFTDEKGANWARKRFLEDSTNNNSERYLYIAGIFVSYYT